MNLNVVVRIRPPARDDPEGPITRVVGSDTVSVGHSDYKFARIFDYTTDTEDLYHTSIEPMLDHLYNGMNCTIMAYGQTGSGKTFTMVGNDTSPGVIHKCLDHIFQRRDQRKAEGWNINTNVSVLQIYMDNIQDLLQPDSNANLRLRQAPQTDEIYVQNARWEKVKNASEALFFLNEGQKNRVTTATDMNKLSSRSHLIYTLRLDQVNFEAQQHISATMHFVDLAGSESVQRTNAQGITLQQSCFINKSLTDLSSVIKALIRQQQHIPYRNCKLTRFLTQSLGGNSHTCIVLNCSAAADNRVETLSTLSFGQRAMSVTNRPRVNKVLTVDDYKVMMAKAEEDLSRQKLVINGLEKEIIELRQSTQAPSMVGVAQIRTNISHIQIEEAPETPSPLPGFERIRSNDSVDQSPNLSPADIPSCLAMAPEVVVQRSLHHLRRSLHITEPIESDPISPRSQNLPKPRSACVIELEDDSNEPIIMPPNLNEDEHLLPPPLTTSQRYFTPRTIAALRSEIVTQLEQDKINLQEQLEDAQAARNYWEETRHLETIPEETASPPPIPTETSVPTATPQEQSVVPVPPVHEQRSSPLTSSPQTQSLIEFIFLCVGVTVLATAVIMVLVLSLRFKVPVPPTIIATLVGTGLGSLLVGWGLPHIGK